jgi:hypothetical protein
MGTELDDDRIRIGRGYPLGSRPIQYEGFPVIIVPCIGHFRSRDLIARKVYASNFERIRAQTFPEMAKTIIATTT